VMTWAKLSTILEPENLTRRIYGFDTFSGFPSVGKKDDNSVAKPLKGALNGSSYDELQELIKEYDKDRFLGHIDKVHLIKGDVKKTIPKFVKEHPHLVISLLFLDMDLYNPTKIALKAFFPRMPKGAVIAFDELDNPMWPGETLGLLESVDIGKLSLRRLEWDPYISYAIIE